MCEWMTNSLHARGRLNEGTVTLEPDYNSVVTVRDQGYEKIIGMKGHEV